MEEMPTSGRDPDTFLPLRAVEFQVVLSLSEGDKHGYAIIQDARSKEVLMVASSMRVLIIISPPKSVSSCRHRWR